MKGKRTSAKKSFLPILWGILGYGALGLWALLVLLPFAIALVTALTPETVLSENGFQFFPGVVDFGYFQEILSPGDGGNIYRSFLNTLLYISVPVFVGTFTSAMAGYAFARINFKGRNILFYSLLAVLVIPGIIITFPSYLLFTQVYRVNEWFPLFPLIVPGAFGSAFVAFFLRQFFLTLPKELEEAAEIDGLGRFQTFLRIILPVSLPAITAQLLLSFNACYNDYLGPLLYVGGKPQYYTVQLFVYGLSTNFNRSYPLLMAGGLIALLPTLILFIAGQKFFVQGIVMTGIKG